MNSKVVRDLVKAVVSFALLFGGIWVFITLMPNSWRAKFLDRESSDLISYEQEIKLGDLMAEVIEAGEVVIENTALDSAMWVITRRLLNANELTEYDYKFVVLDNPQVNAFAIPGGRIYVFKGLLDLVDTPEELAAVLAHEMGHVEHRHSVDKLIKEFGIAILFGISGGEDVVLLSDVAESSVSTSFDRKYEKEADQFSLSLMESAQMSPKHMARVFRKFNKENFAYDERLEFVMTHPHNNSRIKAAMLYEVEEGFVEKPIDIDWEWLQEQL